MQDLEIYVLISKVWRSFKYLNKETGKGHAFLFLAISYVCSVVAFCCFDFCFVGLFMTFSRMIPRMNSLSFLLLLWNIAMIISLILTSLYVFGQRTARPRPRHLVFPSL